MRPDADPRPTRRPVEDSIRLGLEACGRGDFAAAARALAEALPGLEARPELRERLGNAYFEIGDHRRAAWMFDPLLEGGSLGAASCARLAASWTALGRNEDAVRVAQSALSTFSADPALWHALGVARRRLGRPRDAVGCYEEAVRLDPAREESFRELGGVRGELGETGPAIAAYREALRLVPTRSETWSDLAVLYTGQKRFEESDRCLTEAIRLKHDNANAWRYIAMNTLHRGEPLAVRRAFDRLRDLNPEFSGEILAWVSKTSGLPPSVVGDGVVDPVERPPAHGPAGGRLLPFRRRRGDVRPS